MNDQTRESGVPVRSGPESLEQLRALRSLRDSVERDIGEEARNAFARHQTWEDVGTALGVTRQAAHARYAISSESANTFATLTQIAGLDGWDQREILTLWKAAKRAPTPSVHVGMTNGDNLIAELHNDLNGLLIVGTSGSGKSSLLRSMLLTTAARTSPLDMQFVLVGARNVSSFGDCVTLPHTVVAISVDNDLRATAGLARRLGTEFEGRQQTLRAAAAADFDDYQARGRTRRSRLLPRLLLVVDDVNSLERDQSGLRVILDRAIRSGRSLGIQVLVTTNRFDELSVARRLQGRLALRTHTDDESIAVIDHPAAASLTRATLGLAYLRTGGPELKTLKTGYLPKEVERAAAHAILDATQTCVQPLPRPWLMPMPTTLSLRQLAGTLGSHTGTGQPVALVNDGQSVGPWTWTGNTSLAIVGGDRTSRRNVLQTLILGLPSGANASDDEGRRRVLVIVTDESIPWDRAPHRHAGPETIIGIPEEQARLIIDLAANPPTGITTIVIDDVRAARRRLTRANKNAAAALDFILARSANGFVAVVGAPSTAELGNEGCGPLLSQHIILDTNEPGDGPTDAAPARGVEYPEDREIMFATSNSGTGADRPGHRVMWSQLEDLGQLSTSITTLRLQLEQTAQQLEHQLRSVSASIQGSNGAALREATWRAEHSRRVLNDSLEGIAAILSTLDRTYQQAEMEMTNYLTP